MEYIISNILTMKHVTNDFETIITFNTKEEAESYLAEYIKTIQKSERNNYQVLEVKNYQSNE